MLYIVGLGLNEKSVSSKGLEAVNRCKKIYLDNYTADFPYPKEELEEIVGKEIVSVGREFVESLKIVGEAKEQDVALLVYGSPLTATTHISLIQEAKKQNVKCEVIHNASIFDAVAETGLQIYKFGKITSMPSLDTDSFMEVIKDNQKINAHSLILIDIGLEFGSVLEKLEKAVKKYKIKLGKIVVCSRLGTKQSKILYEEIRGLRKRQVKVPYCLIIPGKLHFMEEEFLKGL